MSDCAFIVNADKTLANLICNSIRQEPKVAEIISTEEQISFSIPKPTETKRIKTVSIFLYSIAEDATARNSPPTVGPSGKRLLQTSFALRYLITPCTGNEENDHLVLGKIVQVLSTNLIVAISGSDDATSLTVKLDALSLDDLCKLWTALDVPLRASVSITVSWAKSGNEAREEAKTATITSPATTYTKKVTPLYQAVLKTFTEQSDSWKKRNMFQKQMLIQDFNKTTDMSVDEMLTTLKGLGNKLEQQAPTAQFMKPLETLANYYKHQQDQLRGLEKFSRRQRENLELIGTWIVEVKALLEELST